MPDPLVILGLSYAGKEAVAVVGEFVRDVFGASARAAGKGLAAPIEVWAERRAENAKRVIVEASQLVQESGGTASAVPGRVLMPLLEKASLEENDELHERWVALLANAAMNPEVILPAFVSILGELSPVEARLLRRLFELGAEIRYMDDALDSPTRTPADSGHQLKRRRDLAESQRFMQLIAHCRVDNVQKALILLANLARLGLVVMSGVIERPHTVTRVRLSKFGKAFIQACSAP